MVSWNRYGSEPILAGPSCLFVCPVSGVAVDNLFPPKFNADATGKKRSGQ